jgi:hypothetical protein
MYTFSGEHNSALPYTHKYHDKNVNQIRHLFHEQRNSPVFWESGLRSEGANGPNSKLKKNLRYDNNPNNNNNNNGKKSK